MPYLNGPSDDPDTHKKKASEPAFDQRLCDLKLRPAIDRLHVEAGRCLLSAQAKARQTGNHACLIPAFVECRLQVLREHLEEVDRIMREVRLTDGEVTPHFIRSVLVSRVFTIVAAQKGAIQHELELNRMRTGKHNPAAPTHVVLKISALEGELAARYEAEAIELAKKRKPPQIFSRAPDGMAAFNEDIRGTRASATATKSGWQHFHSRFMELAREEQGRTEVITKGEVLRRMDQLLRVSCSYQKRPEVWEIGKPDQGIVCLLDTPPHGVWNYGDGISENFRERVRLCVAEAGRALPDYPNGADPEDFWLHRLYLNLRKNNSDSLFCASEHGGMIVSVCVASATFCSRLQRKALEHRAITGAQVGARGDALALYARLNDAMHDLATWAGSANSDEERVYVYGIQEPIASLQRIVDNRREGRVTGGEEAEWEKNVRAFMDLLQKATQVRGAVVGEHLNRLAGCLAANPDAPDATAQNNGKTTNNKLIGRPRKDSERKRVKDLKAQGNCWKDITATVNAETGQNKTPDAYRALLRSEKSGQK